jgi:glucosamine-6-phosphate deaminase
MKNMDQNLFTNVEQAFFNESGVKEMTAKLPYIVVENFPKLGLLTALRFLEWTAENPDGVISLPTGKTPEYFIRWTAFLLENWNNKKGIEIRERYGLQNEKAPSLKGLQFVQIDEFYPINSGQHNSFYHYVLNFYIKSFDLDINKALLINSDRIPLAEGKHYLEVFPDHLVDLSLRYRECKNLQEDLQQKSIFLIDRWCSEYEARIREKGGLGFFLGGIGPDGHIAFNARGSDLYSTTRLTATNFETQAVAASDLGGIEISKNRLVITIGLETITHNPEAVAIIIAAGEAKANVVKQSLENDPVNIYPATVLQRLKYGRFFLTKGAASQLNDSVDSYFKNGEWTQEKSEKAVLEVCKKNNKYGHRLLIDDLKSDKYAGLIPGLSESTAQNVADNIIDRLHKGMEKEENQIFLHTGPHHDDIMLGLLPHITHQLRSPTNQFHFAVLTSGFTAVTNKFVIEALEDTKRFLDEGQIQMVEYSDFFSVGYKLKWDKDVYHYLTKVAAGEFQERRRGLSHRIIRAIVEIYKVKNILQLRDAINEILIILKNSYDGEKNPARIQILKGMIREFEEELVWAHFGVQVKNVHHLRLGFYTGDIFTEQPERKRDVEPIYKMLKKIKPTVISLTLDPEGSGPDTHYKVLQATAEAVREWQKEEDLSNLRIWGYRNVWYRFNVAEANVIAPVTLNSMAVMDSSFTNCYLSQVDASFPSYELNGKFSQLAQKIWVEQLKDVQLLLGKNYFYQNDHPRVRAAHGLLFFKEMNVGEFLKQARELEKSIEGMAG